MREEKKVSIIIPVYKTEKYLVECVESVLAQEYSPLEIILVDDGSPDGCPEICDGYAEKYSQVKAVHHENRGLGLTRNHGVEVSEGEYLYFLDSDDLMDGPGAITALMQEAVRTDADITMGNFRKLEDGIPLEINHHHLKAGDYTATANFRFDGFYRYGHLAYDCGKLYKKSFLTDNNLFCREYSFCEDKAHNMLCHAFEPKYAFIEDSVFLYRVNQASLTFRYKPDLMPLWIQIASDFHEELAKRGKPDGYRDVTDLHIFFGSFFIAKQELQAGKGIKNAARQMKQYGQDPFVKAAMADLAKGRYVRDISGFSWRVMIRTAATLFHLKGYFLFAFGIAFLLKFQVDGKISDKRNRVKQKENKSEKLQEKAAAKGLTEESKLLCNLLQWALTGQQEETSEVLQDEKLLEEALDLAQRHKVLPLLYDRLEEKEEVIAQPVLEQMALAAQNTVQQSYRLLFLTKQIVDILEKQGISVLVLKGSGVAANYPVPEYRKAGDVDLLFQNEEEAIQAGDIL